MSGSLQPLVGYGAAAYKIANSLRFRSSANAYLSRTPGSAGNQQKFTFSTWLKRGALSNYIDFFGAGNTLLEYYNDNTLYMNLRSGATNYVVNYANVFRDPSAWYHIVWSVDTTQATASDRAKIYVNGVQLTAAGSLGQSWCPQNTNLTINSTVLHYIGGVGGNYFDGYMADINFIDGQALDPTAFGAFDTTTGVWTPKSYAGTYGTNGFHLNFSNGTSTTTLGYDSSGNSNNWTTNNISLTAGSTYDWMLDSPTPFAGSSYGVGNYAVLNPLVQSSNTFSNGNLTVACSSSTPAKFVSSIGVVSGKWYMEFGLSTLSNTPLGISKDTTPRDYLGMSDGSSSVSFWPASTGTPIYVNGSLVAWSGSGTTWTASDIAGLALDADAATISLYKNGVLVGSAFSYSSYWTGLTYFAGGNYISGLTYTANFGQRPFAYTPPTGYKSLCTYNLPTPTIQNGANYMAATLWTGNNSSQSVINTVNGVSFQPDFVWIKNRTNAYSHVLQDVVRGVGKTLQSNTTNAEQSNGVLTSLNSNGFSLDNGTGDNTGNLVGWQWKAGGTAVTNTAGSITSSVSANTTAGFSVVTYTGTGATGTVGHGLGVAPAMIIEKRRNAVTNWFVFFPALNYYFEGLNTTSAGSTPSTSQVTVSSSTVSIVNAGDHSASGGTYVWYCFAAIPGYSAFGSFVGNGSSDGPFIYCGFRPRFILGKNVSTNGAGNWFIQDTSRSPYNAAWQELYPNSSSAETTSSASSDNNLILSNGFKAISSGGGWNQSGETYIYAAFAENPFTNALAR